jgi:5-methylcytosine-specific restriction endonuclease McrA
MWGSENMNEVELKDYSNDKLIESLAHLFSSERKISRLITIHLAEVWRRRLFADYGFSSLFEMLIKYYHLSESSARQRLKAMQLIHAVPEAQSSLVSGQVNLTTLAQAQRQIDQEEKVTGQKVEIERKKEIVEKLKGKTQAQLVVELFKLLPHTATSPKPIKRRINSQETRLSLNFPNGVLEKMNRLKDLWAHKSQSVDYLAVIDFALDEALKNVDPVIRKSKVKRSQKSAAPCATDRRKHSTYYSNDIRCALWSRAQSQCEFVDTRSGRRCSCTAGLQVEHVIPVAKGGGNDLSNLKLFCRTHNSLMARRHFGARFVAQKVEGRFFPTG